MERNRHGRRIEKYRLAKRVLRVRWAIKAAYRAAHPWDKRRETIRDILGSLLFVVYALAMLYGLADGMGCGGINRDIGLC